MVAVNAMKSPRKHALAHSSAWFFMSDWTKQKAVISVSNECEFLKFRKLTDLN